MLGATKPENKTIQANDVALIVVSQGTVREKRGSSGVEWGLREIRRRDGIGFGLVGRNLVKNRR